MRCPLKTGGSGAGDENPPPRGGFQPFLTPSFGLFDLEMPSVWRTSRLLPLIHGSTCSALSVDLSGLDFRSGSDLHTPGGTGAPQACGGRDGRPQPAITALIAGLGTTYLSEIFESDRLVVLQEERSGRRRNQRSDTCIAKKYGRHTCRMLRWGDADDVEDRRPATPGKETP